MIDTSVDFTAAFFQPLCRDPCGWRNYWSRGSWALYEAPPIEQLERESIEGHAAPGIRRSSPTTSLKAMFQTAILRRRMVTAIAGGLLVACLLYCLIAPSEYEAKAQVALRTEPASSLSLAGPEPVVSASVLSAPVQLETLAGVLRSDRLAWTVILHEKLYQSPAFMGRFAVRFPGFRPEAPDVDAESYLLERFHDRLRIGTMPRTLLVDVRFRSRDARLSAAVANGLISAYTRQQTELRQEATDEATGRLQNQREFSAGMRRVSV